jgi:hypothetical protein
VDFIDTDVRSKEEVFPSLGVSLRSVSKSTRKLPRPIDSRS